MVDVHLIRVIYKMRIAVDGIGPFSRQNRARVYLGVISQRTFSLKGDGLGYVAIETGYRSVMIPLVRLIQISTEAVV